MTSDLLSPCCFLSIASMFVVVMLNGWRWGLLSLVNIGIECCKLRVLSKNNPRHVRYLSYWQRFVAGLNSFSLLIVVPAFVYGAYLLSTKGADICPPGERYANVFPCDALQQAVRSFLSIYMLLILVTGSLSIYYAKVVTRYAKLLNEAPQSFQLEDGRGSYGQVEGQVGPHESA
ncbi:hypothetical protein BDZ88DRAFT_507064 [Geranomyces variabilis]|nr:hypothetical protein BDZ88DRAFT_507064 [Geranomyces variabilis]KAJ3138321.1 hypothetical protein HDU90_001283 [Geranomyces variabilis]